MLLRRKEDISVICEEAWVQQVGERLAIFQCVESELMSKDTYRRDRHHPSVLRRWRTERVGKVGGPRAVRAMPLHRAGSAHNDNI